MKFPILFCLAISFLSPPAFGQSQDLKKLIDQLRSDQIDLRNDARRKLKDAGPRARPELERAAKDSDPNVAATCAELLRVLATTEKLSPALRAALPGIEDRLATGGDAEWTRAFLDAVAMNPATRAFLHPELVHADLEILVAPALRGADDAQAFQVCLHLLGRPFPSAIPELAKLLPKGNIGQIAGSILQNLPYPETLAALAPLLKAESPQTRMRAAEVLGPLHLPESAPKLLPLLSDPNDLVKGTAIRSLGELRYRPAGEPIRKCLAVQSQRIYAIEALGKIGCKEATAEIASSLDDPNMMIRGYAAMALGELGAREAIPRIAKLLVPNPTDQERYAVAFALGALGRLGAKDAVPAIRSRLSDGNVGVRSNAIVALAALGDRESAPLIVSSLTQSDIGVSQGARHALRRLKAVAQVPQILALAKEDPGFSAQALATLADLGARDAVGDILPFLKGGSPYARAVAAEALCRLGCDRGVEILIEEHDIVPTRLSLNALRQPDGWAKLERAVLREAPAGRPAEVADSIARELGLTLDLSPKFRRDVLPDAPLFYLTTPYYWGPPQPMDFLEWIASVTNSEFILEGNQLRWVSRDEGKAFWKTWHAGRSPKPEKR